MTQPSTGLRVGAIGAGRVGATLSAALGRAGHEIVAVAGESDASRRRSAALLPGVPVAKPSDVARACDLLLLTVPDDMLPNVVAMLSASGAIREGQYVAHTSGRHGLAVLEPAAAVGARADRAAPGDDLHRHRGRPAPPARAASSASPPATPSASSPSGSSPTSAAAPCGCREDRRTLYHAGLAHGANHLVTLVTQAMELLSRRWTPAGAAATPSARPTPCARCSPPPSTTRSRRATPPSPARSCAATSRPSAPTSPTSPRPRPHTLPSYVAMARATLDRVVLDGRVLPIRAAKLASVLDAAERRPRRPAGRPSTRSAGLGR